MPRTSTSPYHCRVSRVVGGGGTARAVRPVGRTAGARSGGHGDHPPGRLGAPLGGVHQLVEGVVLDRLRLHPGHQAEAALGRRPLDLRLQDTGRGGRRGLAGRPDDREAGDQDERRQRRPQPAGDVAGGEQFEEQGVDRDQGDGLDDDPGDLADGDGGERPGVRPAGRPDGDRDLPGERDGHGAETELEPGAVVGVPPVVVGEFAAEEELLRGRGAFRRGRPGSAVVVAHAVLLVSGRAEGEVSAARRMRGPAAGGRTGGEVGVGGERAAPVRIATRGSSSRGWRSGSLSGVARSTTLPEEPVVVTSERGWRSVRAGWGELSLHFLRNLVEKVIAL